MYIRIISLFARYMLLWTPACRWRESGLHPEERTMNNELLSLLFSLCSEYFLKYFMTGYMNIWRFHAPE